MNEAVKNHGASADAWKNLYSHAERLSSFHLRDINHDVSRMQTMSLQVGKLSANFARQRIDAEALAALFFLAESANVDSAIQSLFNGDIVNRSEQRAALHTALRSDISQSDQAKVAHRIALQAREKMTALVQELERSGVTDVINIGIGGSDLGPRLAVEALQDFHTQRFRIHFISNVDGSAAKKVLQSLDPEKTAAILVSKTFGTQETLLNGKIVKDWLKDDSRLYAVSANVEKAQAFGVKADHILPMWDWVGGRYSMWSCVGFSIALAVGANGFEAMLKGAAEMDAHVLGMPTRQNLAAWHALLGIWNRNALGYTTQAVIAYDERLSYLPDYLQQLVMESLGKSASPDNTAIQHATVPVVWGGTGSTTQHSFFQAMHQGTDIVPIDFIGVLKPAHAYLENHHALLANLFAQSEAMANGDQSAEQQKQYPGNRSSSLFLLDELTPHSFGALLALYEHSVYIQSVLWGINAFDQWGVELGKKLANGLMPALRGEDNIAGDAITQSILKSIR
jgi:glucose-6-phosphate isomerase